MFFLPRTRNFFGRHLRNPHLKHHFFLIHIWPIISSPKKPGKRPGQKQPQRSPSSTVSQLPRKGSPDAEVMDRGLKSLSAGTKMLQDLRQTRDSKRAKPLWGETGKANGKSKRNATKGKVHESLWTYLVGKVMETRENTSLIAGVRGKLLEMLPFFPPNIGSTHGTSPKTASPSLQCHTHIKEGHEDQAGYGTQGGIQTSHITKPAGVAEGIQSVWREKDPKNHPGRLEEDRKVLRFSS